MKPRKPPSEQNDLVRARLVKMIDMRHELVKLAALIDLGIFEREWAGFFLSHTGRRATSSRLIVGVCYLQHAYARLGRGGGGPMGRTSTENFTGP
jgi:transposase, IS5 family